MTSDSLLWQARGEDRVFTVSELTARIKATLEASFPEVWVSGEVSDFARPRSGHCYLTLKDGQSQLRAVIWRAVAARLRFDLHDGLDVVCRGHVDVYAPRGTYQLIIREIQPAGIGALELALRQLRSKLDAEGLFARERKRPLPRPLERIALVTSPSGAAVRDFLEVLRRRAPGVDVFVVPVRVQGEGAAEEIVAAIKTINSLAQPMDCLVLARGGGSLEDLWAFNEEPLVRAIVASGTVVVSAVGHEIDVTLSDLAADVRAATPSEAAELLTPAVEEVAAALEHLQKRLLAALRSRAAAARSRLDAAAGSRVFRRPHQPILDLQRRLDELESRSLRGIRGRVEVSRQRVDALAGRLESLSPLAVLGRGYCLCHRAADGRLVRDAAELAVGQQLSTRFARGRVISRVEGIKR